MAAEWRPADRGPSLLPMGAPLTALRRTSSGIALSWSDGLDAELQVVALRQQCPCAFCVDELTGQRRLDPTSVPEDLELRDMQPVGRYAYRILFGDGHDSGIYTVERLRALSEEAAG